MMVGERGGKGGQLDASGAEGGQLDASGVEGGRDISRIVI